MNLKLYKYLKYEDGAKALLENGTLKYSHMKEFNDPFDCLVSYDLKDSIEYYKSRKDLIKAYGGKLNLSPAQIILETPQFLKQLEMSLETGEYHKDIMDRIGICCLSMTPDNILMWSHYSDHHKGIVVEFDTHQDRYSELSDIEKNLLGEQVLYQEFMPKVSLRNSQDGFSAVQDALLTKSPSWEYEKEFRVIAINNGPGIYRFDHSLISRVIVGVKMTNENFEDVIKRVEQINLSKGLSISVVKARMSEDSYKLFTT